MSPIKESESVLKEYLKIATSYSIPLFWGTMESGIAQNGTAFILDTGVKKFVVTAAHVYRSYIKQKNEGNASICQLGKLVLDLDKRLLSIPKSKDIDIATFEIHDDEIETIGSNVLRGSNQVWPPSRPEQENMVVVSGFPGVERKKNAVDYYTFGYYCFNTPINTVSDRHFGCSFDREYWVDAIGKGMPPDNYDMGGISGAPAIALIRSEVGIVTWRLAGVVYEATASEMLGEIMFAHHADFIQADGSIIAHA
ncbi:hypothetical protein [Aestuariibacter sp. A3R04]|uniref:hypothetical protein n=1 Tax=Aestuariibacter sp. A3R04 TaxID=2841571 RepID=UPI001C095128|nr:hypothetical protein [Aestuariibacter sp. A3R04]MBU3021585.1 hypothetical protein [Aestuariibacter sp. A3R04]